MTLKDNGAGSVPKLMDRNSQARRIVDSVVPEKRTTRASGWPKSREERRQVDSKLNRVQHKDNAE
jgi:hypothetical protein